MMFLFLDTVRTLHFSGWKLIIHACSKLANLFRSSCRCTVSTSDVIVKYMIASSANSLIVDRMHETSVCVLIYDFISVEC